MSSKDEVSSSRRKSSVQEDPADEEVKIPQKTEEEETEKHKKKSKSSRKKPATLTLEGEKKKNKTSPFTRTFYNYFFVSIFL